MCGWLWNGFSLISNNYPKLSVNYNYYPSHCHQHVHYTLRPAIYIFCAHVLKSIIYSFVCHAVFQLPFRAVCKFQICRGITLSADGPRIWTIQYQYIPRDGQRDDSCLRTDMLCQTCKVAWSGNPKREQPVFMSTFEWQPLFIYTTLLNVISDV